MGGTDFIGALGQIEEEKGIPKDVLIEAVKASIESAYRKRYGATGEIRVELGPGGIGQWRIVAMRQVVAEVENAQNEISVSEAREVDPASVVGDVIEQEVTPKDFGRIAAQTAKQVIVQRVREAERDIIYGKYQTRIGEVITGEVQRRDDGNVYVSLGPRTEALLPYREQIPSERPYAVHRRLKFLVLDVRKSSRTPQVIVSRTHPDLVRRLFELEVPEIYDGIVEMKGIEREPGFRAKISVLSHDEKVDPVGACVGHRGSRVQAVVDELAGEKLDIVRYRESTTDYLAEALSPAQVSRVVLNERDRSAAVVVPEDQLSLAIGKRGQNVRLASRLTGWRLDVVSEEEHQKRQQQEQWASEDPAEVRIRVYDLAGELSVTSREAIEMLQEMGVPVVSHASTIDGYTADDVRRRVAGDEAARYGPRPPGVTPTTDDPSDSEEIDDAEAVDPAGDTEPEETPPEAVE